MSTWNEGGGELAPNTEWVFELPIAATTLVFVSEDQVREAEAFFGKRLRPPSASYTAREHYWHPWFARLPAKVLKSTNRPKIAKALANGISEHFG